MIYAPMNHLRSDAKVTSGENLIYGAISGLVTRFCVSPMDVLKIRLQLLTRYQPIYRVARDIFVIEGYRAFWKGNFPAELLYVTYSSVQFYALSAMNRALRYSFASQWSESSRQFIAGGCAGTFATFVTYPLDFLRTRGAATTAGSRVIWSTIRLVSAQNGLRGFYHGVTATVLSVFPYTSVFFSTYSVLRDHDAYLPYWFPKILSAASIASTASKTAVFPLDTIRRRIQVHGVNSMAQASSAGYGKVYSHNIIACGKEIVMAEGIRGLYRGVSVAVFKTCPAAILSIYVYEAAFVLNKTIQGSTF